jgi:hypothetical protein
MDAAGREIRRRRRRRRGGRALFAILCASSLCSHCGGWTALPSQSHAPARQLRSSTRTTRGRNVQLRATDDEYEIVKDDYVEKEATKLASLASEVFRDTMRDEASKKYADTWLRSLNFTAIELGAPVPGSKGLEYRQAEVRKISRVHLEREGLIMFDRSEEAYRGDEEEDEEDGILKQEEVQLDLPPRKAKFMQTLGERTASAMRDDSSSVTPHELMLPPVEEGEDDDIDIRKKWQLGTFSAAPGEEDGDDDSNETGVYWAFADDDEDPEERAAALAAALAYAANVSLGPPVINMTLHCGGGCRRWEQTALSADWNSLPKLAASHTAYAGNVRDRLGGLKFLLEEAGDARYEVQGLPPKFPFAVPPSCPKHPLWGLVNDVHWMWRSGRLGKSGRLCATAAERGWWERLSLLLSLAPVLARQRVKASDEPGVVIIGGGELNRQELAPVLDAWEIFWREDAESADNLPMIRRLMRRKPLHFSQEEMLRKPFWEAKATAIETALHLYENELEELGTTERTFALGWARSQLLQAAALAPCDEEELMATGTGFLPEMVLDEAAASLLADKETARYVARVSRLGCLSSKAWCARLTRTRRACRTGPGRFWTGRLLKRAERTSRLHEILLHARINLCSAFPDVNYRKLSLPLGIDPLFDADVLSESDYTLSPEEAKLDEMWWRLTESSSLRRAQPRLHPYHNVSTLADASEPPKFTSILEEGLFPPGKEPDSAKILG